MSIERSPARSSSPGGGSGLRSAPARKESFAIERLKPKASHAKDSGSIDEMPPLTMKLFGTSTLKRNNSPGWSARNYVVPLGCHEKVKDSWNTGPPSDSYFKAAARTKPGSNPLEANVGGGCRRSSGDRTSQPRAHGCLQTPRSRWRRSEVRELLSAGRRTHSRRCRKD